MTGGKGLTPARVKFEYNDEELSLKLSQPGFITKLAEVRLGERNSDEHPCHKIGTRSMRGH